ncbi:MAG: hypothetical protein Q4C00_01825, partial [Bacillota bacterium]|nr:hypothetical protein [Bacillota bacterium]
MICNFILGLRGSGKTTKLYENIFAALNEGKKAYLILPEQATFYHEKNIDIFRNGRSLWNLEITSFRRLAEKHIYRPVLTPLGQHLSLYRSIQSNREKFESFKVKDISPGLVDSTLSAIEEVLMNSLSSESLREKATELEAGEYSGDLPKKLRDIALILESVNDDNKEKIFDGNLLLKSFGKLLQEKDPFENSVFFFDDFSDFTAVEYDLISIFMELNIPLDFTFLWQEKDMTFDKTDKAIKKIEALAVANGIDVHRQILPNNGNHDAIGFLAANCLECKGSYPDPVETVKIFHSTEPSGEVEAIAREIRSLLARGYSSKDIVVDFRDIEPYSSHIKEIFPLYNIDYYMDDPISLQNDPAFFYASALVRVVEERWSYSAVFALIKSGLFPMDSGDCDEFENYCLAHAVKGSGLKGTQSLTYAGERENVDLEKINEIRNAMRDFLLPFTEALEKAETVLDYAVVIWDFLGKSRADNVLNQWRNQQEASGDLLKATELEASLVNLAELLDQIVLAFGSEKFNIHEFAEVFRMGCKVQEMRTIPQNTSAVEINILGQSRPAASKVVFLAGVNEGSFPNYASVEGFFNRNDRDILAENEVFWSRSRKFFFDNENLLMYQGLSQATEKLYLSY